MQTILSLIVGKTNGKNPIKSTRIDSWLFVICYSNCLCYVLAFTLSWESCFLWCKPSEVLCGPLWSSGQDVWFSHLTSWGLLEQHGESHRWTCHLFWFLKADQKYLLAKHDHLWHQLHAELWRPWLNVLWRQLTRQAHDAKLPTNLVLICLVLLIRL